MACKIYRVVYHSWRAHQDTVSEKLIVDYNTYVLHCVLKYCIYMFFIQLSGCKIGNKKYYLYYYCVCVYVCVYFVAGM